MRRHAAKMVVPATVLAAALGAGLAGPAWATASVSTNRLAGPDRFATAAAIASGTFTSARTAIVASGADPNFPDAIASSYLAGNTTAPVLLTDPASLSSATQNELKTLGVSGVDVVGGPNAVSDNVVSQLKALGYVVDRIAGATRYSTAAAVAEAPGSTPVGSLPSQGRTALLATGENFPDALTGGPVAYADSFPTLLTETATLAPEASGAMDNLAIKHVIVLGGPLAVSDTVVSQVQAKGITVERLAGQNRQQTATAISDFELSRLGFPGIHVNLARGDNFPDALAGGPHGGHEGAAILLTSTPDSLGADTDAYLRAHTSTIASIDVFGGPLAVSDATVAAAQKAAENG